MISCQLDNKIKIVGLDLCLVRRLVSDGLSAFLASVDYDVSLLCIRLRSCRAENSEAGICSVAGVYINVQRAEAEGAMIARGVSERKHLFTAIFANKSVVVF